jgi:hypothetical protein
MPTPRLQRVGTTQLLISSSPGILVTLFGLPFLAGGVYFAYQLVVAIHAYLTRAPEGEFLQALAAFGIIILMALIFGVPGLLLVFFRYRVLIDSETRAVTQTRHFGLFRWVKHFRLSQFTGVTLAYKEYDRDRTDLHNQERTYDAWHVELVGTEPVVVGLWDDRKTAASVAEEIAAFTNLCIKPAPSCP